ncbi:MAG: putative pectin lyase [Rhodospirillales bacterium]|nr:putative pectin lyase [Rhodospirillales bacterium]
MSNIWVGPNEAFTRIDTAVAAAQSGDTVFVRAGTYVDQAASVPANVNLIGVGGTVNMTATHDLSNGKAFLISHGGTIENFNFSNAQNADLNGAGIRYSSGDLTVKNSVFQNNQDGILGQNNASGTITLLNDQFTNNGAGDGRSHAVYVNDLAKLTVANSVFEGTNAGHDVKSRADTTVITGSSFSNGANGTGSYAIDLPNGGQGIVEGNSFNQSANSQNPAIVHFGGEGNTHANSQLTVANNQFADALSNGVAVANQTGTTVDLAGNVLTGVGSLVTGASHTVTDVPGVPTVPGTDVGVVGLSASDLLAPSYLV